MCCGLFLFISVYFLSCSFDDLKMSLYLWQAVENQIYYTCCTVPYVPFKPTVQISETKSKVFLFFDTALFWLKWPRWGFSILCINSRITHHPNSSCAEKAWCYFWDYIWMTGSLIELLIVFCNMLHLSYYWDEQYNPGCVSWDLRRYVCKFSFNGVCLQI